VISHLIARAGLLSKVESVISSEGQCVLDKEA